MLLVPTPISACSFPPNQLVPETLISSLRVFSKTRSKLRTNRLRVFWPIFTKPSTTFLRRRSKCAHVSSSSNQSYNQFATFTLWYVNEENSVPKVHHIFDTSAVAYNSSTLSREHQSYNHVKFRLEPKLSVQRWRSHDFYRRFVQLSRGQLKSSLGRSPLPFRRDYVRR